MGRKKSMKKYDPGGTRTQDPPFGSPNGLLIELATQMAKIWRSGYI